MLTRLRRPPIASAECGIALLSHGLNRDIMGELAEEGPLTRPALAARLHASPTKIHECLANLREAGVVTVCSRSKANEYGVTKSGRRLHAATAIITRWFRARPGRALTPSVGWRAFADFGESWRMVFVEWIVRCAPTAEDLAAGFDGYNEHQLAETLDTMREAGMVMVRKERNGRARYRLTPWAARAIGILAAISRWEQEFGPPGSAAIEVDDAIVAILATLPLVRLDEEVAGVCTFAAEAERDQQLERRLGTVWARVRRGRVVDLGEGAPPGEAVGWAGGPFSAWLAAALDGRAALRCDGRTPAGIKLVSGVVAQVHAQLMLNAD